MEDCIFCKIAAGDIKSWKVYEDDLVVAFFDVNPEALGHVLVVPKKHFKDIFDIEEQYIKRVAQVAKKIAVALKGALGINNVNLVHNTGKFAQQEILHFHVHIWPRHKDDAVILRYTPKPELKAQFDDVLEKIKKHMIQA